MKKITTNVVLSELCVFAALVLATLTGILLFNSNMPSNTKYSFTVILISAVGFLSVLLNLGIYHHSQKENENHLEKVTRTYQEQIDKITADRNNSAEKVVALERELKNAKITKPTGSSTEPRVAETAKLLEEYRNSFPYTISDGFTLYNLIRTEFQAGSHSRWLAAFTYNNQWGLIEILRPDVQNHLEMLTLVASCKEPSQLDKLNIVTVL